MVSTTNDVDHEWPPKKFDHLDIVMPLTPLAYVPDTGMPNDQLEKVEGNPYPLGKPYTYPHISESVHGACGQCKFFVAGGACAIVKGTIDAIKGTCKFWEGGQPLDADTLVFPLYKQIEAEYFEDSYEPYLAEHMTEIEEAVQGHAALSECSCNKIKEGGVGSGIKGHTTADDPAQPRPAAQGLSDWDTTDSSFRQWVDNSGKQGFSYDPTSGKGYDFFNQNDINEFFSKYSQNGQPVYVIGVTNQVGKYPTRRLQSQFEQLQGQGQSPMIGYWRDDATGIEYTDIAMPVSGIDDATAMQMGTDNAQEAIVRINSDGRMNLIKLTTREAFGDTLPSIVRQMMKAGAIQEAQQFEEDKHPRDPDGKFTKGGGAQGFPKEGGMKIDKPKKKYGEVPEGETPAYEGAGFEGVELSIKPTQNHINTAKQIMKFYPEAFESEDFMIRQAWEADQVRNTHEAHAKATQASISSAFPNTRTSYRIKKRYNILEKMGRKAKYKTVHDLNDVSGIRTIADSIADVQTIGNYVRENFDVINEDNYIESPKDGYRTLQFDVRNNDGTISEVQVRTPNQETWANWRHDWGYKPPTMEMKAYLEQNEAIVTAYANDMSTYYYMMDQGIQAQRPDCPEVLLIKGGCMDV